FYGRFCFPEVAHPGKAITLILNTHSPPNMFVMRSKAQRTVEHVQEPFRSLRQNLIRMPVRLDHDLYNIHDISVRHLWLEQVAHAIYENIARAAPQKRLRELLRNEPQIKSLFIRVTGDAAKSFSE